MVLGLLNQLQIFWQLHLIELLGLLTCLEGYSSCSTWYIQGFQHGFACKFSSRLMEFKVRYLALSHFFSVIWLGVVLDGKSSQEYPASLHSWSNTFPTYYTLMTFLMMGLLMTFLILLSMLMILLSTLNVIRHLNCSNNKNWPLALNLIYETLGWDRKCLLILMLEKLNLLGCWGLSFPSSK